jgi:hypothetical protein
MSWKPEFLVQGEWYDNGQAFATETEAKDSAQARFHVWSMPTDWRAVQSVDPVSYKRVDGRDSLLEAQKVPA